MTDLVKRLRSDDISFPETCGCCAQAADRIEALEAERGESLGYATRLLDHFVAEHFPHNPDWKPLPELIGVLTQLDNVMTIARDYKDRIEALENVLREILDWDELPLRIQWIARAALAEGQDRP